VVGVRKRRQADLAVQPLLLTVPQVAACLGLSRSKVYQLMAVEGLPFIKLGAVKRVPIASLQRWIERQEQQASA